MVPMSFRVSCFLVEMPADAVVPASRIDETKTRKSNISLMGSNSGWFRRTQYITSIQRYNLVTEEEMLGMKWLDLKKDEHRMMDTE